MNDHRAMRDRFSLIQNWRAALKHAWSMYAAYLGVIVNGVYITVAIITSALPAPPLWLAVFNGALFIVAGIFRLLPQIKVSGDKQ